MRRNMHIGMNEVNQYTIMVDMLFSRGLVLRKKASPSSSMRSEKTRLLKKLS